MSYSLEQLSTDFLIIGGGVAGLRAAIELARNGEVIVVTKDAPLESSTEYAQGGVAVVLSDEDEIEIHFEDTIRAGDGLCIRKSVGTLVEEGPMRIRELIAWGAEFDQEGSKLAFTQEAAHSKRRILHAHGDSTGKEILRVLTDKVRQAGRTTKIDFAFTRDLIIDLEGRCIGAVVVRQKEEKVLVIMARAVLLATGGAGRLFERTTNPPVATGDGIAMSWRAGAELMDLEFVQFHPTALYRHGTPSFLLSEAMRGEGGMLRNIHGLRFMDRYHPARELAPRDVVTRAIHAELLATGADHVFLDMTHLSPDYVRKRFPRIYSTCMSYGIDITAAPVPVSPAAHYTMGGVRTDLWGATTVPGLFAAGEAACTGVHGANRLASNSLLEGLVFGERAGLGAARYAARRERPLPPKRLLRALERRTEDVFTASDIDYIRQSLRKIMWEQVGIVRDKKGITNALKKLKEWDRMIKNPPLDRAALELKNMIQASLLIARSALSREGSVGAHCRGDFPAKGKDWKKRIIMKK
ncbi:MAG: L-aspartate oxidase [Nitrospiraceae bacterium]|nr:L-aspartate oxidase [Nitrospiraceae bacterium]